MPKPYQAILLLFVFSSWILACSEPSANPNATPQLAASVPDSANSRPDYHLRQQLAETKQALAHWEQRIKTLENRPNRTDTIYLQSNRPNPPQVAPDLGAKQAEIVRLEAEINQLREQAMAWKAQNFIPKAQLDQAVSSLKHKLTTHQQYADSLKAALDSLTGDFLDLSTLVYEKLDPLKVPSTAEFVYEHLKIYITQKKQDIPLHILSDTTIYVSDFREIWASYDMALPANIKVVLKKQLKRQHGQVEVIAYSHYPLFRKRKVKRGDRGLFRIQIYSEDKGTLISERKIYFAFRQ